MKPGLTSRRSQPLSRLQFRLPPSVKRPRRSRRNALPTTTGSNNPIVVLDEGGHIIAFKREDGD
jgi:hypothetical protein